MATQQIAGGVAHKLPPDLRQALGSNPKALRAWQSVTSLARNEWICWTVSVKNPATRENHVRRTISELTQGKRRPCCWLGCIHRTDKALSPSQKWVISTRAK